LRIASQIYQFLLPDRVAAHPVATVDGNRHGLSIEYGIYTHDSMIKRELIAKRDDPYVSQFFHLSVDKRPEWQFFNVKEDPENLNDLARDPDHAQLYAEYKKQLTDTLTATGDPRVSGYGQVWEDYPRTRDPMRYFPQPDKSN
jgi:uncharacterized sulfatase